MADSFAVERDDDFTSFDRPGQIVEALEVYNPKQFQYDEYDGDNDQKVDPTASAREAWTYVPTEETEQPQYYENHDNSPQHEISPFE